MEKDKTIIKWIQGNELSLAIPLQKVTVTPEGKKVEPYYPTDDEHITVVLSNITAYWKSSEYTPTLVDGNVVTIVDDGSLGVGTYDVTILVTSENHAPRRSKWKHRVEVYDSNEVVLDAFDDFPDYGSGEVLDAAMFYFAKGDKGDPGTYIPESIIFEEDGIYQIKDNEIYPVSHPDLSTQPSILPQRFGNLPIREVLIANGRENEIPIGATVLEAFSFNDHQCVSAFLEKDFERRIWQITNDKGVVPDFTLVRYVGEDNGGYYYNPYRDYGGGGGGQDEGNLLCTLTLMDNSVVEVCASGNTLTEAMIYAKTEKGNIKNAVVSNYVVTLADNVFSSCLNLTSVTIPESVTSIGAYAFYSCSGLTSVSIPESVTSIGASAFSGCSGLTSVTIPNSVTSIVASAFYNCSGLSSVTIGSGVTSIGAYAFSGCSGLTSVTIPNSVTSIVASAFYNCSGLSSIVVESGNSIYDSREECNAIIKTATNTLTHGCKNTTIPNSVTSIGAYAFYNCSGLTSVSIPESVTSIGTSAFYNCSGLTSVTIGSGVTSIGWYAFYNCSGLTSVTIGSGVTSIGAYAFEECQKLTYIRCNASIAPLLGSSVFEAVGTNGILEVPQGSTGYETWMEQLTPKGWTKVEY